MHVMCQLCVNTVDPIPLTRSCLRTRMSDVPSSFMSIPAPVSPERVRWLDIDELGWIRAKKQRRNLNARRELEA